MIWLLGTIIFLLVVVIVEGYALLRCYRDGFRKLGDAVSRIPITDFPPVPDCQFKPYEFRCNAVNQPCLYSPGSEPERICALREEDKKNQGQKIPQVIPAPRWSDRSPPGEE